MAKYKYDYKVKDTSKALKEIEFKIDKKSLKIAKEEALKNLGKTVEIKGFRPGKAPKKMVEELSGPKVLEEALNIILPEVSKEVLQKEDLMPIAPIEYTLLKYAPQTDIEFRATVYILPPFKAEKIEKIKVKKADSAVTKKDVDLVIEEMFKKNPNGKPETVGKNENEPKRADEDLELVGTDKRKQKTISKKPDDKWVESLKLDVKSLEDLKKKIEKELAEQKKYYTERKLQYEILEEAMKISNAEVPEFTVKHELGHKKEDFLANLKRINLDPEKFYEMQKTSEEELKKGWEEEIRKSIMTELLLEQISRDKDFKVESSEIDNEISKISDPKVKEEYSTEKGKTYIEIALRKQKALSYLIQTVKKNNKIVDVLNPEISSTRKSKKAKKK